jgi:hypothetical protein
MYRVTGPERSESSTRHSGSSSAATDVVSVRFAQHYRGGASVASVRLGSAAIVPYPASSAHPLSVLGTVRIPLDAFTAVNPALDTGAGEEARSLACLSPYPLQPLSSDRSAALGRRDERRSSRASDLRRVWPRAARRRARLEGVPDDRRRRARPASRLKKGLPAHRLYARRDSLGVNRTVAQGPRGRGHQTPIAMTRAPAPRV